jgi:hypothetical protein
VCQPPPLLEPQVPRWAQVTPPCPAAMRCRDGCFKTSSQVPSCADRCVLLARDTRQEAPTVSIAVVPGTVLTGPLYEDTTPA